jgi:hypothetical protein
MMKTTLGGAAEAKESNAVKAMPPERNDFMEQLEMTSGW